MTKPLRVGVDRSPATSTWSGPKGSADWIASDLYREHLRAADVAPPGDQHQTASGGSIGTICAPIWRRTWWPSEDGRTCTFRIRQGVRGGPGDELTADDVKWGWDAAFALASRRQMVARAYRRSRTSRTSRSSIATPLRSSLAAPNPALPRTMSQCRRSVYDTRWSSPDATPAIPWAKRLLARFPPASDRIAAKGRRRPDRARRERKLLARPAGRWTRYGLSASPAREASIEALEAGEVDLVQGVSLDEAARLRGRSNI